MFFSMMGFCSGDYSSSGAVGDATKSYTWFEETVCLNKKSYMGALAMLFLFVIVYDVLKKKLTKKTEKRFEKIKTS